MQKEQSVLQPWGVKPLFPINHWEMRKVSKDCLISYLGNKYSVPFRYAGQKVKIRVTLDQELEIYDEQECIARHPLASEKSKVFMIEAHYEGLHPAKKEQEQKNQYGLATPDSSFPTPVPNVETRSLTVYAAFEEGDIE